MLSLAAGSPTCNCKNPDTCIHNFELKVKDNVFYYKGGRFTSLVEAIDDKKTGVPVSLSLKGKGCVTQNPLCPQGIIYSKDKNTTLKVFNDGQSNYNAKFYDDDFPFFKKYDAIDFLVDFVLPKDPIKSIPKTVHTLNVGQCNGDPYIATPLTFDDGMSKNINHPANNVISSYINIYPAHKWEACLAIGLEADVKNFTDRELRKQQKKENEENGVPQRNYRGWTKRERSSISKTLEIDGKLSCESNGITNDYSQSLKLDFKNKSGKINLLNRAIHTIDFLCDSFSTAKSNDAKITMLDTQIVYPTIEIKGSGELKESQESNKLYIERKVSVGFAPLIGVKITLDLLQAFAAWYHSDVFLAVIREGLLSGEDDYEKGENAAYAGLNINFIIEGEIDLSVSFSSNEKKEWEWEKDDSFEAKLSLTLNANCRAGARFYFVYGAIEMDGKAISEGCLGFDSPEQDKLDLVLYHNGVKAEVSVTYTYGVTVEENNPNENRGLPKRSEQKPERSVEKEWIIYEKMEKKDSKCRFSLM